MADMPPAETLPDLAALEGFDVLLAPGYDNSPPDHWQAYWARLLPNSTRIVQDEWLEPRCLDWCARIEAYVARGKRPALLVAHSLACIAAVRWAHEYPPGRVVGTLLVAPADVERTDLPVKIDASFCPIAMAPLPFAATLIASRNDPFCTFARAADLALGWGASLADAGSLDHINSAMMLGDWPYGLKALCALADRARAEVA